MKKLLLWSLLGLAGAEYSASAQVQRIWLTHQSAEPSRIVVSWETAEPGDSVVEYGTSARLDRKVSQAENVTLHHVEIPLPEQDVVWHYRVSSGAQKSDTATFKGYPTQELRVAVVGDWGNAKPDMGAVRRDNPHVLLTAGDNVPNLHQFCGAGVANCTKAYSALIDREPELFRSTPFLPVLGNHDREIRQRGPKPPAEAVYDTDATAFRTFFALPGDEWKWTFDLPGFDVRFVALDLQHISDLGTTWQTCHAFAPGSEQFEWYRKVMETTRAGFVVTLHNEKSSDMRRQAEGEWGRMFQRGSAVITGFGYFAERADVDGFPYYNTCLSGTGAKYRDPKSKFFASEDNYMLLTFRSGSEEMIVEVKNLTGAVLERQSYAKRKRPAVKSN